MSGRDPLVPASWLLDHRRDPGLVVLDATYHLPAEGRDAAAEFADGHIPGARRFDIDVFADPEAGAPHMAPSPARFARLIGALGVDNESLVVAYDRQGLFSAARAWWLLRLFGHGKVRVLDGGLPAWIAAGGEVETGETVAAEPVPYVPSLHAALLRGIGDMRDNLESGRELVLDARGAARFSGAQPEPRPGMRAGHIPGSRSLPYTELLEADGTMRDAGALRALFGARGVGAETRVVASCGSGVTAAVLLLALRRAGLPDGALYDGSWSEWGGREDVPVEVCAN